MKLLVVGVVLAASTVTAAPKKPASRNVCSTVNPLTIADEIRSARRVAENALDRKDFSGYEDANEKKVALLVDQRLWQHLCIDKE